MRKFITKLLSIILLLPAYAWSIEDNSNNNDYRSLHFMTSAYAYHYKKSKAFKPVWLVGLEKEYENDTLAGVAIFSNSFGLLSTYVYPYGMIYRNKSFVDGFYAKWSVGIIYGYVGKHKDKVSINYHGFSPAFIPSVGIEKNDYQFQITVLGDKGLMFQLNKKFK